MASLRNRLVLGILAIFGLFSLTYYYHQLRAQPPLNFDLSKLAGQTNLVPVVIIGSGPAGLGAGIYCARAGLHTLILDGSKPGGLLMGTSDVENWPGEKRILGPALIDKLRAQNQALGVKFVTATVSQVDFQQWPFELTTTDNLKLHALTVIIATGANPKTLQVPGEADYWGKGVSACAICDAPYFKDEQVVVVGGGDSALEEALQLAPHAAQVTILVRGEKLRAAVQMQQRIQAIAKIKVRYRTQIKQILGDGTKVTGIEVCETLADGTEQQNKMAVDGVFLAISYHPNTKLFQGQVALDQAGYIQVSGRTQATSVAGVFAAGEVDDHYYRQAGIACAEGNKAALDVDRFLQRIGFIYYRRGKGSHEFYIRERDRRMVMVSRHANETIKRKTLRSAIFTMRQGIKRFANDWRHSMIYPRWNLISKSLTWIFEGTEP